MNEPYEYVSPQFHICWQQVAEYRRKATTRIDKYNLMQTSKSVNYEVHSQTTRHIPPIDWPYIKTRKVCSPLSTPRRNSSVIGTYMLKILTSCSISHSQETIVDCRTVSFSHPILVPDIQ